MLNLEIALLAGESEVDCMCSALIYIVGIALAAENTKERNVGRGFATRAGLQECGKRSLARRHSVYLCVFGCDAARPRSRSAAACGHIQGETARGATF